VVSICETARPAVRGSIIFPPPVRLHYQSSGQFCLNPTLPRRDFGTQNNSAPIRHRQPVPTIRCFAEKHYSQTDSHVIYDMGKCRQKKHLCDCRLP
jgi:hypothetical protein